MLDFGVWLLWIYFMFTCLFVLLVFGCFWMLFWVLRVDCFSYTLCVDCGCLLELCWYCVLIYRLVVWAFDFRLLIINSVARPSVCYGFVVCDFWFRSMYWLVMCDCIVWMFCFVCRCVVRCCLLGLGWFTWLVCCLVKAWFFIWIFSLLLLVELVVLSVWV